MNIKALSDSELLYQTKLKVQDERRLTLEILDHLREIESRKLYAKRGFSSLFVYCIKELGYSESEAYRRIAAMRLTNQVPEVTEKIQSGLLTLTNVVQAVSFFKAEEKRSGLEVTLEKKREVLLSLEKKSTREAEKHLLRQSPIPRTHKERSRQLTGEHLEVKIILDKELQSNLDELKALMSHKNPSMTYTELISELAKLVLKKLKPHDSKPQKLTKTRRAPSSAQKVTNPRYIPSPTKAQIWKRDQGKCTYVDPITKQSCESKYLLQYDHIHPVMLGGVSEISNLRLLCQTHNLLMAELITEIS